MMMMSAILSQATSLQVSAYQLLDVLFTACSLVPVRDETWINQQYEVMVMQDNIVELQQYLL